LALRVSAAGHRSFVLIARYPCKPKNPTRRALGDYGALTLEQARDMAREWLALIRRGIDPKTEAARQRAEAKAQQVNTFAVVATAFLGRHVKGPAYVELERQTKALQKAQPKMSKRAVRAAIWSDPANAGLVARSDREGIAKKAQADQIINTEFVSCWGPRPVRDITPGEVAAVIRTIVKRDAPYQAHNALGLLNRLYTWAIGTHEFGIDVSPTERLSPKDLIGKKESRQRILSDDELRLVWLATDGRVDASAVTEARSRGQGARQGQPQGAIRPLDYPLGPLIRLMILTGQREREVAGMAWSEIDFDQKMWTIPARRMKGDRAHEVPLASEALALLAALPRFGAGDCVFTTTGGAKPVSGFGMAKSRVDAWINQKRSADGLPDIAPWVFHDLRRTARTHFSALPVQDIVRELVIAHAQKGLHRVYDQHSYQDEKRECLTLWEAMLLGILKPPL
jgi:integrase